MRAPQLDEHAARTMADSDRGIVPDRRDRRQVVAAESQRTAAAAAAAGQSAVDKDADFVVAPERTASGRVEVIDVHRVARGATTQGADTSQSSASAGSVLRPPVDRL